MTVIYQILETVLPFSWLDYNFMKNAFVAILAHHAAARRARHDGGQ